MGFWHDYGIALMHVLSAPFRDISVFWQLIPILLVLFVLGGYFVVWRERLGWNSALTNSLTLFWVVMTSMQEISGDADLFSWIKFSVFSGIGFYTLFLLFIVFTHKFSDKLTFLIASPLLIHFTGIIVVLWAHGLIQFSSMVAFSVLSIFVALGTLHVVLGGIFGKEVSIDGVFTADLPQSKRTFEQPLIQNTQQQYGGRIPSPTYRQPVQKFQRRTF